MMEPKIDARLRDLRQLAEGSACELLRTITRHEPDPSNPQVVIQAEEYDRTSGNACHTYGLSWDGGEVRLPFIRIGQPGVTNEALLAVVDDRLEGFQSGPYACEENHRAQYHIRMALAALAERTAKRQARGVEGTLAA